MSTPAARIPNPFGNSPVVAQPTGASAMALAQRDSQQVLAMMWAARSFPRNVIQAVDRITTAFCRPSLCEVAMYAYARGGEEISGLSIRSAEELARQWTNVWTETVELTRHDGMSECMAYSIDLETGVGFSRRFHVKHWRDTKKGGYAIREERDIREIVANTGARVERAMILKVIPGDVQDLAERQIALTLTDKAAVTPEALKAMLDRFAPFGVSQEHIEKRIQRHLESMLPAQLLHLRRIYSSLKDGMSTPDAWFDLALVQEPTPEPTNGAPVAGAPATAVAAAKQKLAARAAKKATEGAPVPFYDTDGAVTALRASATVEALDATWERIRQDYADTSRSLPVEVEAVRNDRRSHLEQQAAT